jgi:hypothetical protein
VSLLKTIAAKASVISIQNAIQREVNPMLEECGKTGVLAGSSRQMVVRQKRGDRSALKLQMKAGRVLESVLFEPGSHIC